MPVTGTREHWGGGHGDERHNHHLLAVTDIPGFPSPCFWNHRSPSPTRDTYGCTIWFPDHLGRQSKEKGRNPISRTSAERLQGEWGDGGRERELERKGGRDRGDVCGKNR